MPALLLVALLVLPATVLADGAVQAVVTDGVLDVTGDDADNVLQIGGGAEPETAVVTGLEATSVNGGSGPVTLTGVRSLRLVAAAGNDRVELLRVDLAERLLVKLGSGRDRLVVEDVRVRGKARIKGSADPDDVTIRSFSRFSERLVVETGRSPDAVTLLGSDFFDDVGLDLGDDDDDLLIEDCDFDEEFEADGGDGRDEIDFDGTYTFAAFERRRIRDFEGGS